MIRYSAEKETTLNRSPERCHMNQTVISFLKMASLELAAAKRGIDINSKKLLGMLEDFSEDFRDNLGLVQIGNVGDVVPFDPSIHDNDIPFETGESVQIKQIGFSKDGVVVERPFVSLVRKR
jgi:hypothetical protein